MARKIALIHDWLTGMRGGEKVLEVLCDLFPSADVFTLLHVPGSVSPAIERHRVYTSPLQKFPNVGACYRHLLPLMPWAIGQFNFSGYELLVSTSHCVAKGALAPQGVRHYCYCHTPMRYVWDQYDQYFGPGRAGFLTRRAMALLRPALQRWDLRSNERVHEFIANSANVAERIQRLYGRSAQVIYPPVDYAFYSRPASSNAVAGSAYFLIVSAFAPYKRVDLAIEAFSRMGERLVIIGDGQERDALRRQAGANVEFLGWQSGEVLRRFYADCQALIFPGEEDFGIVPVEAMAAGRPVIAYGRGGALETVLDGRTGLFFREQTAEALIEAVHRFKTMRWESAAIQSHAAGFDRSRCEAALRALLSAYAAEMSPIPISF